MPDFFQPERRGLVRMQRPQTAQTHPDADLLAAFSEQTLSVREREQILQHLSGCESCREVAALAFPETAEVSTAKTAASPSFWKWPVMRWGTVAASAVIVVVAVSIGINDRQQRAAKFETYSSDATPSARTAAPPPAEEDSSDKLASSQPLEQPKQAEESRKRESKAAPNSVVAAVPAVNLPVVAPPTPARQPVALARAETVAKQDHYEKPVSEMDNLKARGVLFDKKETGGSSIAVVSPRRGPENARLARDGERADAAKAYVADAAAGSSAKAAPSDGLVVAGAKPAAPAAAGETVEVTAQGGPVVTTQQADNYMRTAPLTAEMVPASNEGRLAKSLSKSKDERTKSPVAESSASLTASTALQYNSLSTEWRVTPQGDLLNSSDLGRNWVQQLPGQKFTHVQSVRNQVWASGPNDVLMHSTDAGQTWAQVTPSRGDTVMQGEIISINFADENRGVVKTSAHETWSTTDGGKSWRKQ